MSFHQFEVYVAHPKQFVVLLLLGIRQIFKRDFDYGHRETGGCNVHSVAIYKTTKHDYNTTCMMKHVHIA